MLISSYKLAQCSKGDGIAPFRSVERYAEGMVCMTGGDEGPLAAALVRGGMDETRKSLKRLVQTFGPKNVYVELQRHGICEQEVRNQALISLAREFQLPLLATNGVAMATDFEREVLDVLTTIRHGCSLDEAGLLLQLPYWAENRTRHCERFATTGVEGLRQGKKGDQATPQVYQIGPYLAPKRTPSSPNDGNAGEIEAKAQLLFWHATCYD